MLLIRGFTNVKVITKFVYGYKNDIFRFTVCSCRWNHSNRSICLLSGNFNIKLAQLLLPHFCEFCIGKS